MLHRTPSQPPPSAVATPVEEEDFLSPATLSSLDEYAANPRFLELQDELRSVLFTQAASLAPTPQSSRAPSPVAFAESQPENAPPAAGQGLDISLVALPPAQTLIYLKNWLTDCAPFLDKFDTCRTFGVLVPLLARSSPALLYAILAFSARHLERKHKLHSHDSLELYQESIRQLAPILQAKDPNVLMTVCILACLELMSASPRDWRRHVDGCASLFQSFGVNGLSGGPLQAVFWCYARMDLIGAIMSNGTESLVLPISAWVPSDVSAADVNFYETTVGALFHAQARENPDMHANWAVYLCARTCDLAARRTRTLEVGAPDPDPRPFAVQWRALWEDLGTWAAARGEGMLPIAGGGAQLFPEILFAHWPAISGNQMYHTACIMMLEIAPSMSFAVTASAAMAGPQTSAIWHARRIIGISLTNPHSGCLINAIQPLFVAGRLLSHRSEHVVVAKLFWRIERLTAWGAIWRLRELERVWGYEGGEIVAGAQ